MQVNTKFLLFSIFRDLQDVHTFAALKIQIITKLVNFRQICFDFCLQSLQTFARFQSSSFFVSLILMDFPQDFLLLSIFSSNVYIFA